MIRKDTKSSTVISQPVELEHNSMAIRQHSAYS